MLKKVLITLIIIVLLINIAPYTYAQSPSISAEAAILIDAETGSILYEKNADKQMYPASTTKILTAILAIENGNLNEKVIIDNETPYGIDGSHIALETGEILTLKDLLYALLIESANDAAVAIAKHISGSVNEFANLMNKKAKEIGVKNTHFTNPNGLPDENHVTTAYDLAMIAKYAMENETFREIVKNYNYKIKPTNKKEEPRYLKSSNRLLYGTGAGNKINVNGKLVDIKYPGADGIKTGYTVAAQQCLVATAVRGEQRLISVVLRAVGENVYIDTHKLLNYGFENFAYKQIGFKNEFVANVEVMHGDKKIIPAIVGRNVFVTIPADKVDKIEKKMVIPDEITAPISENQVLGRIEYMLDGQVIDTVNIISTIDVNQKGIYKVVDSTTESRFASKWWFWLIILFVTWRVYIAYRRYKRKRIRRRRLKLNYGTRRYL